MEIPLDVDVESLYMLDEFMRLESVAAQMKREPKETEKEQDTKMEERSINLRTR